ncbi:MAG: TonB-dependent receptor [Gemmatimonadaceae bacterium]|nr:TonB-dependent receptor [Gemmatimonadaceae bacterium]
MLRTLAFRLAPLAIIATTVGAQATGDTTALPRLVITADRVPVPLSRVTATVSVLDGAALRAAGVTHVIDALRRVPGVAVARSGSFGAQTSLFTRGGESDYTKILVDGVPMNDPGGAVDLGALTLDDVERIEVVRGPASVVHGSDAVSGVVQIVTRRAGARRAAHVAAGGGSYGGRTMDASLSGTAGLVGGAASLARHTSDGILPLNNAYRNTVAGGRVTLDGPIPASIAVRHVDNSYAYPTDGAGRVVDRNASRADRRTSVAVDAERALGQGTTARLTAGWLDDAGRTNDAADGPADTLGLHAYQSHGSMRRRHVAATVQWEPRTQHAVILGTEWASEHQRLSDSSNYAVEASRFDANRITRAAFAQVMGHGERGSYTLGGRIDRNDVYGTFRTLRASAALALPAHARLRVAAGTAFKAPTFFEQFNTAFSVGNAALVPERSTSWDAGLERRGERLSVGATYFAQRFRDLIQYTFTSSTDPSYFNVAAASASGLELEGSYQVSATARVRAGATFLRTRVDDAGFDEGAGALFVHGARLLRRPSQTVTLGASGRAGSRTDLDVQVVRVGTRDDRDFSGFPAVPVELSAYTRVDLGAQVRITPLTAPATLRLIVRADNLFGTAYREVANFDAPRRVLFAGLRAEWR